MKREELIKKWLDHNLSRDEQLAFEKLEEYNYLMTLNESLKNFKAPPFDKEEGYNALKPQLKTHRSIETTWLKPFMKVAALLILGLSIYYYTSTLDSTIITSIAEQATVMLPDSSTVKLSAKSKVTFNKTSWTKNRSVKLDGEAFFKVANGKKFDVITKQGTVSVLGTQFNVEQRNSFFEVTCYEGFVAVMYNNNIQHLNPGDTFKIINGNKIINAKINSSQPSWLHGESNFNNIPLKYVLSEFENYYNYKINYGDIDTSRMFTGSFTHKNLELALKSITVPLNLSYMISEKSILLKRENAQ